MKIVPSFSGVGTEEYEEEDIKYFKIGHQSLGKMFSDFNLSDDCLLYFCLFLNLFHVCGVFRDLAFLYAILHFLICFRIAVVIQG